MAEIQRLFKCSSLQNYVGSQIDTLLSDENDVLSNSQSEQEFYYASMLYKRASHYGADMSKHDAFIKDRKSRISEWTDDLNALGLEYGQGITIESLMVGEMMAGFAS